MAKVDRTPTPAKVVLPRGNSRRPSKAPSLRPCASVKPAPKPRMPAPLFAPGDVLDDTYEIRGVLGSGANGQVFDARDRRLNRRVAIKTAWPSPPALGELLRKEAQALAAIRHPALVTVYAMGSYEGKDYFAMERVPGVTLEAHARRRRECGEPLTLVESLDVLIALAEGLAAVHRAGIAHRDVKPANVMLAPGNRIVLMDLGLVVPEFEVRRDDAKGTPNYMAPESLLGTIEAGAAHLVDTYALGVLAYWLVVGRLPYEGKTSLAVARHHVESPVPEVAGAPPKLAALITEMLAKDPLARPQQLESVSFRLRAVRAALVAPSAAESAFSVLVVDDDREIAKLVKMYVRSAAPKADVAVASSAAQALEMIRASAPNLMFLDLQMPEMNGIELYMVLRAERLAERCTIVAVSAAAQPADVELLYALGVARFIEKGAQFRVGVSAIAAEVFASTRAET
jgi:serine/threonine protein kinase